MLLLDTCILLWLVDEQQKLTEKAKKIIERDAENLFVSSI